MEKVIKIDGKDIRFKATGGTMYRYKAQFGREYLADVVSIAPQDKKNIDINKINFETMFNLAWVLAKTADDTIPPPQQWLDSFEEFPIVPIMSELQEILVQNAKIDRKNV